MKIKHITISTECILSRNKKSDFSFATRSMCSFIVKHAKWIEVDGSFWVHINLGYLVENPIVSIYDKRCRVNLTEENLLEFIDLPSIQKKENVLVWIEKALDKCYTVGLMSEQSRQIAINSTKLAREMDYQHVYKATRPVLSPSKKYKAYVEVTHDTDVCTGAIVIVDRKENELVRSHAFGEKPDELIFRKWLVRPEWRGDFGVVLAPEWGYDAPREVSLNV